MPGRKQVVTQIKLQITGGQANPSPPVGPALGQHGLNIPDFCRQFNERTRDQMGVKIPVVITVYSDKSFTFITKTPPAPVLLKQAAKVEKGSPTSNKQKVGQVTREQIRQIAALKMPDLNCHDLEAGMSMIAGTARSMGLVVVD